MLVSPSDQMHRGTVQVNPYNCSNLQLAKESTVIALNSPGSAKCESAHNLYSYMVSGYNFHEWNYSV